MKAPPVSLAPGSNGPPSAVIPLQSAECAVQFAGGVPPTAKLRPGPHLPVLDPTQCENLAASSVREPLPRFACWLIEQLGLPHEVHEGRCRVGLPDDQVTELGGNAAVSFSLDGHTSASDPGVAANQHGSGDAAEPPTGPQEVASIQLSTGDPFFRWLCDESRERGPAIHARPCGDPLSVYELTEPLFQRYRVDGGSVHLSGCALEDRPFMRLSYASPDDDRQVVQLFFTADGIPADTSTRDELGLAEVCTTRGSQSHADESQVQLLFAASRRCVQHLTSASDSIDFGVAGEPIAATLLWVKRAIGKLQFTIGDQSIDVGFEGWARTLEAPPFVCPHSGIASYHIAATDDGRIAAAEAIETCSRSGERVLASELITCSVTGERVLSRLTRKCPVSGKPALKEEFSACSRCRQQVSRAVLKGGLCQGCRSLSGVTSDDPRLVWILSEFPRLEQWKRWRLSETADLYYAAGRKLWGELLIVFEKETLAPRYAATRGRFRKSWLELDPTHEQELFGERAMEKRP